MASVAEFNCHYQKEIRVLPRLLEEVGIREGLHGNYASDEY